MKYCLVADDGQARVVVAEHQSEPWLKRTAEYFSAALQCCKFHVCRREPSHNGFKLITIETWEKGVKL